MPLYKDAVSSDRSAGLCDKFKKALHSSPDKQNALSYLESRHLDLEIIDKFDIGWCPSNTEFGYSLNYLDILKNRVIFPIKDEYGDVVSFSGRTINNDIEPKYWHEPYNKSFFFYGLNLAMNEILKKDFAIIVEGQMDVITCHKFGFSNTIGLMGSVFTQYQLAKISRFTNNFVFILDGDSAGRKAMQNIKKYMERYVSENLYKYIDVALTQDGKAYDPDQYLNEFGKKEFSKQIRRAKEEEYVY